MIQCWHVDSDRRPSFAKIKDLIQSEVDVNHENSNGAQYTSENRVSYSKIDLDSATTKKQFDDIQRSHPCYINTSSEDSNAGHNDLNEESQVDRITNVQINKHSSSESNQQDFIIPKTEYAVQNTGTV